MAFMLIAARGILVALVLYLTVREPKRGRYDGPLPVPFSALSKQSPCSGARWF
jgi:hypothetical protein